MSFNWTTRCRKLSNALQSTRIRPRRPSIRYHTSLIRIETVMPTVGNLCLLFCGWFVMVSSQSTVDETESSCSQCIGNEIEYLRQIFERTCGPTQQLLQQQLSQMMTTTICRQPTAAENGVNWKQYLVSALTGKRSLVLQYAYLRFFCRLSG